MRDQQGPPLSHTHLYVLAAFAASVQLVIPLLSPQYGYFRDELYYLACAKRLAFGYVDHPPLAPFLLRLVTEVFGDSILAIRSLPALAAGGTVFLTGLIARRLGGSTFAQSLAALAMAIAPGFLLFCSFYSMNPFESLIWTGCVYVTIRLLLQNQPRLWPLVGLLVGLGLLNKHTLIVYVVSLALGLLLTPARRHVLSRWFWLGALLAALVALPNVLWQLQHELASLEFYHNANLLKNIDTSRLEVFMAQVFVMNPLAFPIWFAGLCFFLFTRRGRELRLLGLMYLFLLGTMMWAGSSRPDRMLAAYPVLFAGGATLIASFVERRSRWVLQAIVVVIVLLGGAVFAPVVLPVLPPAQVLAFTRTLSPPQVERGATAQLPQWLADRFGWEEMAASVAKVHRSLPEAERRDVLLLAENYGEAGALELYGSAHRLPPVLSPHNTYHLWGESHPSARTYIAIGLPERELRGLFREVTRAGVHECSYCMNYENDLPIYICRDANAPFEDWWPSMKWYGGAKKDKEP